MSFGVGEATLHVDVCAEPCVCLVNQGPRWLQDVFARATRGVEPVRGVAYTGQLAMTLGITVDLGWPWWVTSVIAVAVAVAAGVAFFLTRHPLARGVLATLAVQGVVLAAVAPAVMDNGDGGSMSAMRERLGGSTSNAETFVLDVQPDFDKFNFVDTAGDKKLNFGDHFLFEGPIYKEGTSEKIGTWFCSGVKFAEVVEGALDEPVVLKGAIEGNYASVFVVFQLDGRGTLSVTGLEPGYDGRGANEQVVAGGTGEFAGARGTATNVMALGGNLDPPFAAPANRGEPKLTNMSRRVTFDLVTDQE